MNQKQRVAEYVKNKREGIDLTQAALAHYLSLGLPKPIRKTHISKWETGQSMPSIWMATAIKATARDSDRLPWNWVQEFADGLIEQLLTESKNGNTNRTMPANGHGPIHARQGTK